MMTLKEAYEQWKKQPGNRTAVQYREAVLKVLLKENADMDLVYFSESFVKGIMRTSSERQELKTQAAAALVSIIEWGADNNLCPPPKFDYTIASPKRRKEEGRQQGPEAKPEKTETEAKPEKEENLGTAPDAAAVLSAGPIVSSRPVVQLDSNLQTVRNFSSVSEAIRETGFPSIFYYLKQRTLYNGYYFAYGDEYTEGKWEPKKRKVTSKTKEDVRRRLKECGEATREYLKQKTLQEYEDEELKDELIRRGYTGEISKTVKVTLIL